VSASTILLARVSKFRRNSLASQTATPALTRCLRTLGIHNSLRRQWCVSYCSSPVDSNTVARG
jgi:hypothetical protein